MAGKSNIEWCTDSWNPIVGCSIVSPGCTNCYAMNQAARIQRMTPDSHYLGTTKAVKGHNVWTGKLMLAPEHILTAPLGWKKPRRIFVNSMGDLFHENTPDEWIDRIFAVMALCPQHQFQVLTKRAERMREYFTGVEGTQWTHDYLSTTWHRRDGVRDAIHEIAKISDCYERLGAIKKLPLPNLWLGVSVEDQERADERIPHLLATPAAVRWISAEPLLGPVDLTRIHLWVKDGASGQMVDISNPFDAFKGKTWTTLTSGEHAGKRFFSGANSDYGGLDWVVVGGESGPNARPFDLAWARSIVAQCQAAGIPCFVKQMGSSPVDSGLVVEGDAPAVGPRHGVDRKGGDWSWWPDDLRVREYPEEQA